MIYLILAAVVVSVIYGLITSRPNRIISDEEAEELLKKEKQNK